MVVLQNGKRIFDKTLTESVSTTGNTRVVELYGVTSYNDITDCILPIKATISGASGPCTLNVNNLGAKSLKVISNGVESDPPANWTLQNKLYFVTYNNNKFNLFLGSASNSGGSTRSFVISWDLLSLTTSSTQAEILEVTGNTSTFILGITDPNLTPYVFDEVSGNLARVLSCTLTNADLSFEFVFNGVLYNYTFTIVNDTFSSVSVATASQLVYPNGNNVSF